MDEAGELRGDTGRDGELRQRLVARIVDRRAEVDAFLDKNRPRSKRLAKISLIGSTVSTAFTAGPGLGGDSFVGSVQGTLGLGEPAQVWQLLCLASIALTVVSALCANTLRAEDLPRKIGIAETANLELQDLIITLEFGQIDLNSAVDMFQECLVRLPFIDD